jgi:hypothetical protein
MCLNVCLVQTWKNVKNQTLNTGMKGMHVSAYLESMLQLPKLMPEQKVICNFLCENLSPQNEMISQLHE